MAVFATSDCQAGGFCQLDTNTDENEKGKRGIISNAAYEEIFAKAAKNRRIYTRLRIFVGKAAKHTYTCHSRAVNGGSLDLHNELLRQVRSVYFKAGRSKAIRPD